MKILATEKFNSQNTPVKFVNAGFDVDEFCSTDLSEDFALRNYIEKSQPEALFVGLAHKLDADMLSKAPIKVIATRTTNITDHIDYKYCEEKGITILNLKGEELEDVTAVAEACLGAMIQLSRLSKPGQEIRGKTLGLWGYGRIAKHLEKCAKVHDMNIIHHDPKYIESSIPLLTLLRGSDFISIHASSIPENKDMVKYSHFEKMERKPFVLNSTRPWLIENEAIQKALENNLISGFWADMPIEFEHPKVVIWNKGGNTYESLLKTEVIMAEKLIKWLNEKNLNSDTQ